MGGTDEYINKITISTQLAQANKPKDVPVPDFCSSFADVFSEQTYNTLPPHRVTLGPGKDERRLES